MSCYVLYVTTTLYDTFRCVSCFEKLTTRIHIISGFTRVKKCLSKKFSIISYDRYDFFSYNKRCHTTSRSSEIYDSKKLFCRCPIQLHQTLWVHKRTIKNHITIRWWTAGKEFNERSTYRASLIIWCDTRTHSFRIRGAYFRGDNVKNVV